MTRQSPLRRRLRNSFLGALSLGIVVTALAPAAAWGEEAPDEARPRPLAPGLLRNELEHHFSVPLVTHAAFRPDGRKLAAGYFRHAINRPGTDWGAWVIEWDLEGGEARILPLAMGPLAYSPDGDRLAVAAYERRSEPRWRMYPHSQVSVWDGGDEPPHLVLETPLEPAPAEDDQPAWRSAPVAFAWFPGSEELAVALSLGELQIRSVGEEQETLRLGDVGRPTILPVHAWRGSAPVLSVSADGRELTYRDGDPASADGRLTVVWRRLAAGGWTMVREETEKSPPPARDPAADEPERLLATSADGKLRAFAAEQGDLVLRDPEGKEVRRLTLPHEEAP